MTIIHSSESLESTTASPTSLDNQTASDNQNALLIPTSIFTDRTLKVLEAVVEYLKESKMLTHHQIAALINRDDRTVWTVYHRVGLKRKPHLHALPASAGAADALFLPTSIFQDRTLKVFEAVTEYLREQKQLTNHQVALLLNRDDRTVWTVYSRAQKKRAAQQKGSSGKGANA